MTTPSRNHTRQHAQEMVSKLLEALRRSPGVVVIQVDGVRTEYNRADARKELEFWEKRAATRRRCRTINLRNACC